MGEDLAGRDLQNGRELQSAESDYRKWTDFNDELLRRSFSSEEYATKYRAAGVMGISVISRNPSFHREVTDFRDKVTRRVDQLSSLLERLDLIDESPQIERQERAGAVQLEKSDMSRKVFVVHGQDDEAKAIVSLFLTKCDLEPIVLHDQPNGGRTIIEKFEREADVGFAVILLTPDDIGGLKSGEEGAQTNLKPRARQNVILELGYFTGKLGRSRVAALKKGDLELPSDISGVVWTAFGGDEAWKVALARELRAAGYEFDVAKALGI